MQPKTAPQATESDAEDAAVGPYRSAARRSPMGCGRRRRLLGALGGVIVAGALLAACGGAGEAGGGHAADGHLLRSTRHASTTSTTALPSCGSNRDPFDPAGSPPPAGSPAIC